MYMHICTLLCKSKKWTWKINIFSYLILSYLRLSHYYANTARFMKY